MAKFLVLWKLKVEGVGAEMMRAVLRQQEYGRRLTEQGKVAHRWHLVGSHGGAWIYDVESNEELDRLLAAAPAYNYAEYNVLTLAEMDTDPTLLTQAGGQAGAGGG